MSRPDFTHNKSPRVFYLWGRMGLKLCFICVGQNTQMIEDCEQGGRAGAGVAIGNLQCNAQSLLRQGCRENPLGSGFRQHGSIGYLV